MPQCKAETASGKQCASPISPPSRSLCKRHQALLDDGKAVVNFETGRKFPARSAVSSPAKASKPAARARVAAPAGGARAAAAMPTLEPRRATRAPGEHPVTCDAPQCTERTLAGTNYCMTHQGMA